MTASLSNADLKWPFPLQPTAVPGSEPVRAEGPGLAGLVWRGSALTIATLGIYRFWYKTDLRRWYWRHTSVAGSAFEYRGTARELLIGFLFALAVLVPLSGGVALGGLFLGAAAGVMLNVLFAFVFLLLVQYGAYRSRRYRLTRTVWRGLRFDQTGSAWVYAALSLAWLAATVLTLGLAFPLMRRSLEGYRIRHTRFGTAQGRFSASLWPLLRAWLLLSGPLLLCAALGALALAGLASGRGGFEAVVVAVTTGIAFGVLAALWAFLLWPYYRVREFVIFAAGTRIGPATFRSEARIGRAYAIHAKFVLVTSVASSAFGILAAAVVAAAGGSMAMGIGEVQSIALLFGLAPVYLGAMLTLGVLKELLLSRPLWQLLAGSLTVSGLDSLHEVMADAVRDESATGEGFADALDFGGV